MELYRFYDPLFSATWNCLPNLFHHDQPLVTCKDPAEHGRQQERREESGARVELSLPPTP